MRNDHGDDDGGKLPPLVRLGRLANRTWAIVIRNDIQYTEMSSVANNEEMVRIRRETLFNQYGTSRVTGLWGEISIEFESLIDLRDGKPRRN